jgi:hypothetical protein
LKPLRTGWSVASEINRIKHDIIQPRNVTAFDIVSGLPPVREHRNRLAAQRSL